MLLSQKEKKLCKKPVKNVDNQSTVVTINRRLANLLQQQFDLQQKLLGKQTWESFDILPLDTWLERCWDETWDERILLTNFQEQLLWEKIIRESEASTELLRIDRTAQSAQQAWKLLHQWQLTLNDIKNDFNYDTQVFVKWANEFINTCIKENYLTLLELPQILIEHLKKRSLILSKKIIFAGFEQLTPQIAQLISNLEKLDIAVEFLETDTTTFSQAVLSLPNQQQEIYTMARWAQKCLQENSNCTIGCIVPNLKDIRDQIERIFTEVFTPFPFLPIYKENLPFNISIGKPLSAYPLIQHAFQILKLGLSELISIAEISHWLRSPFLAGSEEEMSTRAMLDKELHEVGEVETSLRMVLSLAQKSLSSYYCPILANHLQKFLEKVKKLPTLQFPNQWAALITNLLQTLGWPGQRSLDSREFQTLQRWLAMLTEFSSLDVILGKISYSTALNTLQQLAYSIIFQPQTPAASIQILGVLEAIGLNFDYVWLSGMNDETWPPLNQPNPFIPIKIQQQNNMPHASMAIEWKFYQQLTASLTHCSKEIIFSFATQIADRNVNISPIVKHLPLITAAELFLSDYETHDKIIFNSQSLELIEDWQAPAITTTTSIQGGSNILKLQAACPFRAFAQFRLHADTLKIPNAGLDYAERGLLLHSALEHIWNDIQDKNQLESFSEEMLEQLVEKAISNTLLQYTAKKPLTLKKIFTQIERSRLKKILLAWLNYEKKRLPFKVLMREQSQVAKIDNLNLNVRIDRIDQLVDGTQIIIDYKTSDTSIKDWFGERLEEPQLPLYCISNEKVISGVAFAQIQPKKMRFSGIAIDAEQLPNLTPLTKLPDEINDWSSLLNEWRRNLINISNDFYMGNAKVDPKDLNKTCLYCDFKTLCRIYEKTRCRVD